jgi:hypothetical protein
MQTSEIVHQLKAVLPKFTNDFSDSVNITNIVVNGNNVTFATDGNHHLGDNNTFLICNVKNYYEIIRRRRPLYHKQEWIMSKFSLSPCFSSAYT